MSKVSVQLEISFQSLVDTIAALSREDKEKLWQILDNQRPSSCPEDNYDWGIEGQPDTKPIQYIEGEGLIIMGGKNDPS